MKADIKDGMYRIVGDGFVSYSQAHQDLFVRQMLGFKRDGTYLEIGAADPVESNNTYVLERDLGWRGVSVDIDPRIVADFNARRRNSCLVADATTHDFAATLRTLARQGRIDYLSLDVDPASITYKALLNLPLDEFRFSVITYEHDSYLSGPEHMELARRHLNSKGYQLVVSNVMCVGRDFEDWWVDPTAVPASTWQPFVAARVECAEIFRPRS